MHVDVDAHIHANVRGRTIMGGDAGVSVASGCNDACRLIGVGQVIVGPGLPVEVER